MEHFAGKREAQRRADRMRAFREELALLEAEGAIALSPEQRGRLDAHLDAALGALAERFDVDVTDSEKRMAWGMRIASTIAGLALCAAVVLFFYRIWGLLAVPMQVAVLVAAPLAAVAAMEFSARRERTLYYTALLGTVAFAAAVLNLNALGGIFNLPGSPYAFLAWSVFGLGLAYAYRLRLLLAAGLVCGMVFAAMMLLSSSGMWWGAVETRMENLLVAGALVVAAPSVLKHSKLPEFPWVYHVAGLFAVFIAMLALSMNGELTYLPFGKSNVEIAWQLAGLTVAAGVMWRGVVLQYPAVVNLAAGFFALYLYIRLFQWWWDWMPKYLFFLVVGLISLGLLYLFGRLRNRSRRMA